MKFSDLDHVSNEVRVKAMVLLKANGSNPKKIFEGYEFYKQQMTRVISIGIDSLDPSSSIDKEKIKKLLTTLKAVEPEVLSILVAYKLYSEENKNMPDKFYISCEKMNRELFYSYELMKSYEPVASNKI